ncbi:hypothetical protein [Nocardia brasiliensis]|uniref:hypothetical protein n=1 Tax=Nocardia brasiliensis TaxID=37326 RepID=UPI0024572C98|nr:hypothetical protein [Nocardia brasiliensis]
MTDIFKTDIFKTGHRPGALVDVNEPSSGPGGRMFKVTQQKLEVQIPETKQAIQWAYGPLVVEGYLNPDTLDIAVALSVLGITAGPLSGNLSDGLGADLNLDQAKGNVRFYHKNGNEVWARVAIAVTFAGSFENDMKMLAF